MRKMANAALWSSYDMVLAPRCSGRRPWGKHEEKYTSLVFMEALEWIRRICQNSLAESEERQRQAVRISTVCLRTYWQLKLFQQQFYVLIRIQHSGMSSL